ncbi:prolyl-tRNA editing enzyme YbaK/EbsC (Cys-tRNA(Pro) deacylase) [Leucobacter exalbidus]|uniref:Prolyl-tRNA editing enzyme YbaK/EbsC (Cys-tRNA(Pro) deacylase) n=1 Tax=Leucobacter exalbidus TaxID=662960 RepID=A0A940T4H9_9MICO|nr:YbaK/EbsC family protein [Leucobacter exalbidus]MBP1324976.1 prolyl-tRNA editing enzyme YbaK/EbsC (Cys-tRNA(Pro) deacylase) [Leucobacter exalbidus]
MSESPAREAQVAPASIHPERARADAATRRLAVEFLIRESVGRPTSSDFAGAAIVKTIVVQRGDSFLLVVAPLEAQFNWAKLRAHLGVNKLSLPDADAAFAATGYERGTITPLGAETAWPVIVDDSLVGRTIVIGTGVHGIAARVAANDLIRAYGAAVVDLKK